MKVSCLPELFVVCRNGGVIGLAIGNIRGSRSENEPAPDVMGEDRSGSERVVKIEPCGVPDILGVLLV